MLEVAFNRLQAAECHTMPVMQNGRLVGLLTTENLGEFLMIQGALGRTEARPLPAQPKSWKVRRAS